MSCPVPPTNTTSKPTLAIDLEQWEKVTKRAGLLTDASQAQAIGVHRGHLNQVRNGHRAPGPEFIARVRLAFPDVDPRLLFRVVARSA